MLTFLIGGEIQTRQYRAYKLYLSDLILHDRKGTSFNMC